MNLRLHRAAIVGLALTALIVSPLVAKALMIAPSPVPMRVASSDVVIVGKVTSVEEKPTTSKMDGVAYQVAVVKIEQSIKGVKDTTHIRVAWPAPQVAPQPPVDLNQPGRPIIGRPFRPGRGIGNMNLHKDQEALLFLKKHASEPFYVGAEFMSVVNKDNNPNFKAEVADAERGAKVQADPIGSLKSKDPEERYLAAFLQLQKYRTQRTPNPKQEPISAEESKLILTALAQADWSPNQPNRTPGWYMMQPQQMFYRLQLTAADGWVQPKPDPKNPRNFQKQIEEAAKKWLTDHADKYVIKRFVEEKTADR